MSFWPLLSEQISQHTNQPFNIKFENAIGSGCINQAYKISDGNQAYFVKQNSTQFGDMFEVEAGSLKEIANSHTIKVPMPICYGSIGEQTYLVLEHLELSGRINPIAQGQQLAAMHQVSHSQFGWHKNNTIGSTPQNNLQTNDWVSFWRERRLIPQFKLALHNGYQLDAVEQLIDCFDSLFEGYHPQASMLHGDLWGGNAAALTDGTPVIFDPAFYYGDRETDIAMTHLFGGFEARFYAAYNEAWPLQAGHQVRRTFYNLYHIINHLNLFGHGYLGQAVSMADQILAEIR
jgi:fructosamine-3-kinase